MVGLTISTHFQQFEELKFLNFSGGACPRTPKNPSRVSNRPELGENVSILLGNFESQLKSGHEYPDFEEQLSQANEQRNIFFVKLS